MVMTRGHEGVMNEAASAPPRQWFRRRVGRRRRLWRGRRRTARCVVLFYCIHTELFWTTQRPVQSTEQ
jgi:hypothetical protein